jgi:hypothetical protein
LQQLGFEALPSPGGGTQAIGRIAIEKLLELSADESVRYIVRRE